MKALVVLSGGMDSTTALAQSIARFGHEEVSTLTFNYGSKHNSKENRAALHIACRYKVPNKLVHLPFINELFKSDLLQTGGAIPEGHYEQENMKKTVVPFRNGIMLSIAAGYAESIEAENLILGNHAGDHAVYPDCRDAFTDPMGLAIFHGTWKNIMLLRPFERLSKADIVRVGVNLNIPYDLTWSCYKGLDKHCGVCGTCVERLEAFDLVGEVDPVEYLDRTTYKTFLKKTV